MLYLTLGDPIKTVGLDYPAILDNKIKNSVFSSLFTKSIKLINTDINYIITRTDQKYFLYRNGRKTHQNNDSHKIIYALEWQIINDFLHAYKNKIKFHAASLAYHNKGALFIGNSGTGKTSLSIMLMKHHWQLLSDEFGILDLKNLRVYPFPRNIIIKPHHPIDHSRKSNYVNTIYRTDTKKIEIHYFPVSVFGKTQKQPVRLNQIYYLKNTHTADFCIEKLKQYQALPQVLDHLNNPKLIKKCFPEFVNMIFNTIHHFDLYLPDPFNLSDKQQIELCRQLSGVIE
ncbi:MAG: hypothetical protein JXR87_09520 [Candidatus Marinimicrobia bacterium]|nr:hypothetical protein [Candidatus Neomarinimicrobiota bacterium]